MQTENLPLTTAVIQQRPCMASVLHLAVALGHISGNFRFQNNNPHDHNWTDDVVESSFTMTSTSVRFCWKFRLTEIQWLCGIFCLCYFGLVCVSFSPIRDCHVGHVDQWNIHRLLTCSPVVFWHCVLWPGHANLGLRKIVRQYASSRWPPSLFSGVRS